MIDTASGFAQAIRFNMEHVYSARPDAPVVPEPAPRRSRGEPVRRFAAVALRRFADRVEPRRAIEPCEPATA
jgi:hypothetical protein